MRLHAALFSATLLAAPAFAQQASDIPAAHDSRTQTPTVPAKPALAPHVIVLPPQKLAFVPTRKTQCLTIRSYNYSPSDAGPDITQRTGTTTCQTVTGGAKSAVVTLQPK